MQEVYTECKKVIEADERFKHVMAITLNPRSDYKEGVIRCITSRSGDISIKGNVDKSELHLITGGSLDDFTIGEKLNIKNEEKVINELVRENAELLGLEDPDIWIDEENNLMHLYFTLPVVTFNADKNKVGKTMIHLGHAVGEALNSLEMTEPVLMGSYDNSAKEVCIAPLNTQGFRFNLIESRDRRTHTTYSTVRVSIARDMNGPWEYGETVFHPADHNLAWIAGHASPGPLFPKSFIDIGEGKRVGVMNGCEANEMIGDETKYGNFSIGLFIYDYENGKIDWVSPEPLIQDSEAGSQSGRKITFASQFVETGNGEGVLYGHVDDSFVRAYHLNAEGIKKLLPVR